MISKSKPSEETSSLATCDEWIGKKKHCREPAIQTSTCEEDTQVLTGEKTKSD